jgi:hypothetical protein
VGTLISVGIVIPCWPQTTAMGLGVGWSASG